MNSVRDSDRLNARANCMAKVKFVMLPGTPDLQATADAIAPVNTGTQSLLRTLRGFITRVLGRH